MRPKTIGILAGMGPRSTAPFVDMIVTECQKQYGARQVADFPHMMIYSLPAPFSIDGPTDHERAQQFVLEGIQRLENTGVDFIAMPCNTAHTYYNDLAASVHVPVLNMITEACNALRGFERVAICGTEMTIAANFYQRGIQSTGKQAVWTEALQQKVTQLIAGILASGEPTALRNLWREILDDAIAEGADAILVACTEINALGPLEHDRIAIVDATAALARATVRMYLEQRSAVEAS